MRLEQSDRIARTIAKGSGLTVTGTLIGVVLEYGTRVMIARHLGTHGFGLVSIGWSVALLLGGVPLFGLGQGIARYVAYYRGCAESRNVTRAIRTGITVVLGLGVVVAIGMFLSARWLAVGFFDDPELVSPLQVFALAAPLSAILSLLLGALRGFQRADYMLYVRRGVEEGSRLMLVGLFVAAGFGLLGMSFAYTTSLLLGCGAAAFLLRRVVGADSITTTESSRPAGCDWALLRFSFPLMLRDVLILLRRRASTLLLGRFSSASQAGLFNAVLPIATVLQAGLNAINRLFLPVMSGLHARGETEELESTFRRVARWSFFLTFPLFLVFVTFAETVLGGLFGAEYREAATAFIIVCIGFQVNASTGSFGEALMAIGESKANLLISAVYVTGTLILGATLIPTHGILGAAIANSASLICVSFLGAWILFRKTRLNPWGIPHIKYAGVSLVAFLLLYGVVKVFPSAVQQWLLIPMIPSIYCLSLLGMLVVRGLDPVDLEILKRVLRKLHLWIPRVGPRK